MKCGGKREGSGRKVSESRKKMMSFRLAPDVVAFLQKNEKPASQLIENAVRNYYKFNHDT